MSFQLPVVRGCRPRNVFLACVAAMGLQACGEGVGTSDVGNFHQSDMVRQWDIKAAETINAFAQFPNPATDVERRPAWNVEMATVHIAMNDAIGIMLSSNQYFLVKQVSMKLPRNPSGRTQDAAVAAAAYGVMRGLWPDRSPIYQPLYDDTVTKLSAGASGTEVQDGLAIGAEVATKVLNARANDGRMNDFGSYVSGTRPGEYRLPQVALATPYMANIKPFMLTSASQFRAPGPYALTDPRYATDFHETMDLGRATSTLRTTTQTDAARFHTESPNIHWPRNLAQFSHWQPGTQSLQKDAYLSAVMWVTVSDAIVACWESKYHFWSWRPQSAINLADTDGNDSTEVDGTWAPLGPVPPHPEYPAAHATVAAAVGESIAAVLGTRNIAFTFDAQIAGAAVPAHDYKTVDEMIADNFMGRIWGGQHFRHALEDGQVLGTKVAKSVQATLVSQLPPF